MSEAVVPVPSRSSEAVDPNPTSGYILMPEPQKGDCYVLDDSDSDHHWGKPEFIQYLRLLARKWCERHPEGPKLEIGDMSLPDGSQFHRTHTDGLTVDLTTFHPNICDIRYPNQGLTTELLSLAGDLGARLVLYNHHDVIDALPSLVEAWRLHDDHCHLNADLWQIQRAIQDVKQSPAMAYYLSGNVKSSLRDWKGAKEDYTKAVKEDSELAVAYIALGVANSWLGDQKGAVENYAKAVDLYNKKITPDSRNASDYYHRGRAKEWLGDLQGAIADYAKAVEINSNYTDAYASLQSAKAKVGDGKVASVVATESPHQSAEAAADDYHMQALTKIRHGDWKGAIANCDKAIELDPTAEAAAEDYYIQALAKMKLGDWGGAKAGFDKAIELDLAHDSSYYYRGFVKYTLGDRQGAVQDYAKATKLNPDYYDSSFAFHFIEGQLGDWPKLTTDFNKAMKLELESTKKKTAATPSQIPDPRVLASRVEEEPEELNPLASNTNRPHPIFLGFAASALIFMLVNLIFIHPEPRRERGPAPGGLGL